MGLGGKNTALAVKVNSYPCHIASLPLAVNIKLSALQGIRKQNYSGIVFNIFYMKPRRKNEYRNPF